jgi:hypothetical protein
MSRRRLNLVEGQRVGRWTLVAFSRGGRHNKWLCRCDCGAERSVASSQLARGGKRGCSDCWRKERVHNLIPGANIGGETLTSRSTTNHGGWGTRLYEIWGCMKDRCSNRNSHNFKHYGGRGVSVCEEWCNSFVAFRNWANAHGYASNLSIDRIDVDGNYEPLNCRWATAKEQANNKRIHKQRRISSLAA